MSTIEEIIGAEDAVLLKSARNEHVEVREGEARRPSWFDDGVAQSGQSRAWTNNGQVD